jgi:hypothetical protein
LFLFGRHVVANFTYFFRVKRMPSPEIHSSSPLRGGNGLP